MNRYQNVIIFVVLVCVLGILSFLPVMYSAFKGDKGPSSGLISGSIHERISQQSINIPEFGITAQLVDGQAEFSVPAEDGIPYTTTGAIAVGDPVIEVPVYDAKNSIVRNDVLVPLVVNGGGSGSFLHIVRFTDTANGLVQKDHVLLGDRVQLDTISVATAEPVMQVGSEYAVKVTILDRKIGEPFTAEPTIKTEKVYQVINGAFKK